MFKDPAQGCLNSEGSLRSVLAARCDHQRGAITVKHKAAEFKVGQPK